MRELSRGQSLAANRSIHVMKLHYYDGCVVWYVYSNVWLVCMDTSWSVLVTGPYPLSHMHVHVMCGGRK